MSLPLLCDMRRRAVLFIDQEGRCFYCDEPMARPPYRGAMPPNALTLDRLMPRSKGGQRGFHNEVAACRSCNTERGTRPWLMFFCLKQIERERQGDKATAVLGSLLNAGLGT